VSDAILFVPDGVRASLARMQAATPDTAWRIERRGIFRTVVRATLSVEERDVVLEPLSSGELSAELRERRDSSIDALAAFRLPGGALAARLEKAAGGWLRGVDRSPVLRGIALCALVARLRAEDEEYEGREREPYNLMDWLERHGAEIALSEEERGWICAPINSLPEEARYASLPERFASHAFALGIAASPEPGPLPELMSRFGFLSDELPSGLAGLRIQPGRERHLG
jgi:hypothetical protein